MKTLITSMQLLIVLLASSIVAIPAFSQSGGNDPTFNTTDLGYGNGDKADHKITATSIQIDGKIIIGGQFISYDGTARSRIARLNPDCSLDTVFNPGTGANNGVQTVAIRSDGKIIICGFFNSYNGTAINNIALLNTNGSLAPGFNPGTGVNGAINSIAIQNDGKIIIGGEFTTYNGTARNRIARLNTDGSLDGSFNPSAGNIFRIYKVTIQNDGKIIVGGEFLYINGASINVARLNADGSSDSGFQPGTGANGIIRTIAIQSDGKITIGGAFTSFNGAARNYIARLNINGSLDASFNPGTGAVGTAYTDAIFATTIQSDGKIIIGGEFTSYNGTTRNKIARLNTDGSLDVGFDPGTGANGTILTNAIQSDGKIIIGGQFRSYNGTAMNSIARLNTDGSLTGGFNPGTGANYPISTIAIQSDGKIVIGGDFTSYNGTARNYIARVNTDGSLDAGFNPGTGANSILRTTTIQSNGKIIVGGEFTSYNGNVNNYIARLNSDGSLDAGFNPGTGPNTRILKSVIQNDGKIIIVGDFTFFNGTARNGIARLNSDGSLDASFNPGTGANSIITTAAIQSDGKILIGGWFTSYNGNARNYIARLNADGNLDAVFNPGTGANNTTTTIAIQSDGKIVIGGSFTSYNGTTTNRIARLNSDGTLDAGFNVGTGANSTIYTSLIQSDGKLILGGSFTTFNGMAINRIALLNTDGSLDAGFNSGTGANATIFASAIQSDGKIIISGYFTAYNETGRNRLARVLGSGAVSPSSSSDYFRTITSGNWNAPATWESATNAAFTTGVVSPATLSPNFNANAIIIRNGHTVTVTANTTTRNTTINTGGSVIVNPTIVLTIK